MIFSIIHSVFFANICLNCGNLRSCIKRHLAFKRTLALEVSLNFLYLCVNGLMQVCLILKILSPFRRESIV